MFNDFRKRLNHEIRHPILHQCLKLEREEGQSNTCELHCHPSALSSPMSIHYWAQYQVERSLNHVLWLNPYTYRVEYSTLIKLKIAYNVHLSRLPHENHTCPRWSVPLQDLHPRLKYIHKLIQYRGAETF